MTRATPQFVAREVGPAAIVGLVVANAARERPGGGTVAVLEFGAQRRAEVVA
jgi:hypothetical protein